MTVLYFATDTAVREAANTTFKKETQLLKH